MSLENTIKNIAIASRNAHIVDAQRGQAIAQVLNLDYTDAADEIESMYAQELPSEVVKAIGSSAWQNIETVVINSYFSKVEAGEKRELWLKAVNAPNMLQYVVDAKVNVTGGITNHIGFGAIRSSIWHKGTIGYLGNQSQGCIFEQVGRVTGSIGSYTSDSRFMAVGDVQDVGHHSQDSYFFVHGNVGHLLRAATGSFTDIIGDVRNAAFAQSKQCGANVYGNLESSVGNNARDLRIYLSGTVAGRVFIEGIMQDTPLVAVE